MLQATESNRSRKPIHAMQAFAMSILLMTVFMHSHLQAKDAPIPETKLKALAEELAQGARGRTSVAIRRTCKGVIRKVDERIKTSPDAADKYRLLGIKFEAQKRLLSLENTERNRQEIFETAAALLQAPDEYAELRLGADLLLSERDLAAANAKVAERIRALDALLHRYRGTNAEWRSLQIGSLIATKLLDFDYVKEIHDRILERFSGNHEALIFRRKTEPGTKIDAIFQGTFKTADGLSLSFPHDRIGHQYLVYFWSQRTPNIDAYLKAVKAAREKRSGRFEVYSANLDELPDAGQKRLRSLGLDWTALHLPGGTKSPVYRAYANQHPDAILVNALGHAYLQPMPQNAQPLAIEQIEQGSLHGWNIPTLEGRLDKGRYLQQLRYLFVGEFLAAADVKSESIPPRLLQAIQACFVQPPCRYRLTEKEALANYRKAEKLCTEAISRFAESKDVWILRNRRIIARLGRWNLERDAEHLEEAVREAQAVLALDLPPMADVPARFCLAKQALRTGSPDPEKLLAGFIKKTGADQAPPPALAAACMLALETNARKKYEEYRQRFFSAKKQISSGLWPVCTFLRDRHHRYRNFWASPGGNGYGRPQKYAFRHMVGGLAEPLGREFRLNFELKTLDGETLKLPEVAKGKMLGVIFAEPPADEAGVEPMMGQVNSYSKTFAGVGVKVIVAFLSDDANAVKALLEARDAEFQAGMLAGGLENPLVQKLGILSADRIPNPLLYRPDGTVAWWISGVHYKAFRSDFSYAISKAVQNNIEKVRSDAGFESLENGNLKKALTQFDAFTPLHPRRNHWAAARHQGKALAYMGLKDWKSALVEINAAIARRRDNFKSAMCKCHGVVEMYLTKAAILDQLGRKREAAAAQGAAAGETLPHAKLPPGLARQGVPLGVYYDWLKRIRLAQQDVDK